MLDGIIKLATAAPIGIYIQTINNFFFNFFFVMDSCAGYPQAFARVASFLDYISKVTRIVITK